MKSKITQETTVGDIIQNYPAAVEILMEAGIQCVGCGAAHWESIGEGLRGHGMPKKEIDVIIKKLNESIKKENPKGEKLAITEKAASKLKELLNNKKDYGLRIDVSPGGCSGFRYEFSLENKQKKEDVILKENGIKVFVNKEKIGILEGSKIDYLDTLQGAGFKVSNPNAKSTCGCGESFR